MSTDSATRDAVQSAFDSIDRSSVAPGSTHSAQEVPGDLLAFQGMIDMHDLCCGTRNHRLNLQNGCLFAGLSDVLGSMVTYLRAQGRLPHGFDDFFITRMDTILTPGYAPSVEGTNAWCSKVSRRP